jgi:hypothetical protein
VIPTSGLPRPEADRHRRRQGLDQQRRAAILNLQRPGQQHRTRGCLVPRRKRIHLPAGTRPSVHLAVRLLVRCGHRLEDQGKFSVTVLPQGRSHPSVPSAVGSSASRSTRSASRPRSVRHHDEPGRRALQRDRNSNVPTIQRSPSFRRSGSQSVPQARDRHGRPSRGRRVPQGSLQRGSKIITRINQILNGADAKSVLPGIQSRLNRLLK